MSLLSWWRSRHRRSKRPAVHLPSDFGGGDDILHHLTGFRNSELDVLYTVMLRTDLARAVSSSLVRGDRPVRIRLWNGHVVDQCLGKPLLISDVVALHCGVLGLFHRRALLAEEIGAAGSPVASALLEENPRAEVDVSLLVGGLASILEYQGMTKGGRITLHGQQWPSEFALIGLVFAAALENWRDGIDYKDLEGASSV